MGEGEREKKSENIKNSGERPEEQKQTMPIWTNDRPFHCQNDSIIDC
jgi:hypothetical protein